MDTSSLRSQAISLASAGQPDRAISLLDRAIDADPNAAWAYIERGRLYWAVGNRRRAINDYLAADKLEPGGEAAQLLAHTRAIMDFFCKDLLNP